MTFNYYRQQLKQLGDSDLYRIKITSIGREQQDDSETKWMNIDRNKLDRIAAILEEGD